VYLPAYNDKRIIKLLSLFPRHRWEVFSKRCTEAYVHDNIHFFPVNGSSFVQSMVTSAGVFCGAGFQTPSEAIFLKKKLVVIPMKGQYEQQCNAAALKLLGIPVLKNIKPKQYKKLKSWMESDGKLLIDFPDETDWVLNEIFTHERDRKPAAAVPKKAIATPSGFRNFVVKKIFYQLGS
jgi:predicted glycosyltransferase